MHTPDRNPTVMCSTDLLFAVTCIFGLRNLMIRGWKMRDKWGKIMFHIFLGCKISMCLLLRVPAH